MKTKIAFLIVTIGLTIPSVGIAQTNSLPKAKITVSVKDENGEPVKEAFVGVGGTMGARPGESEKGSSTADSSFTAEVRSSGEVGITVRKVGYYDTSGPDYNFRNAPRAIERAFARDQWQPWNPTIDLVLKKIINPIPMYARRVNRGVPSQNEDLGFDMFSGDFVSPYGQGKTADMIFRVEVSEQAKNDYTYKLIVAFSNTSDGILPFTPDSHLHGSALRSPYSVPEKGFLPHWTVTRSRQPGSAESSNYDPEKHGYFFRIRSWVDGSGKILTANYGKIYGDFMNFTYYLNPTPNDRNIEFDPKRNLFTNLKDEERVTAP